MVDFFLNSKYKDIILMLTGELYIFLEESKTNLPPISLINKVIDIFWLILSNRS